MKQTSKGVKIKAHTKVAHAQASKDRKSSTGTNGLPKKGGHGGKFTWSGDIGLLDDHHQIMAPAFDAKDPNFEDPADF